MVADDVAAAVCGVRLVSGGIFGAIKICLWGVELAVGSESPIDGGLYGEPGSEVSDEAVLESVQLKVATPLEREEKKRKIINLN